MKLTLDCSLINNEILDNEKSKQAAGIVYLLEFDLEGKKLVKVGMTFRRVEDRVCEILVSIWKRYRIFPQCYVKRYKTCSNPQKMEKQLHKQLYQYKYKTLYSFSGSTEFFEIDLVSAVSAYDALIP